jgi:hypothetical protein
MYSKDPIPWHVSFNFKAHFFHMQVDKEINPTVTAERRTLSKSIQMIQEIRSQKTEVAKAQLRTRYGIKEDTNPMLTLPADLFR